MTLIFWDWNVKWYSHIWIWFVSFLNSKPKPTTWHRNMILLTLYKISEICVCTSTFTFSSVVISFIRSKNLEYANVHQLVNGKNMKNEENAICCNIDNLHKYYLLRMKPGAKYYILDDAIYKNVCEREIFKDRKQICWCLGLEVGMGINWKLWNDGNILKLVL